MYEIRQKENIWEVSSKNNDFIFKGPFKTLVLVCKVKGFDLNDFEFGISQMCQKEHDSMHFGLYKKFIYSFNWKDKYGSEKE